MSALAGMSAGVLGLTGLSGFIFYFAATIFLSVSMLSVISVHLTSLSNISLHVYKKYPYYFMNLTSTTIALGTNYFMDLTSRTPRP